MEPAQALKVGKIASSEYLFVGKTEYADDLISISIQIIDVNTNIVNVSESIAVLSDKIAYRISGGEEKDQKMSFLFFRKIYNFLKENYQWLWTAIVIPIAGWLMKGKKKAIIDNNEEIVK
ncbi:hypothetical protein [Candidatus Electronema sp. JM]|uniref:hypothetical protein n=1 Tax=Candidatus Electronema sp. JM TaxID=3401571 RepID=UPI003AA92E16